MKKLKQALALLLALMLLLTTAVSEEQFAPVEFGEPTAEEPAQQEPLEEEPTIEEPTEEEPIIEESAEEGEGKEPAGNAALPAAPEVLIAPEWEYDKETGAVTIPYVELPETLTFEWNFDGTATQYAVQTAPVPEEDNPEKRDERIYTNEPRIELPAANYAGGGWFSLYVIAVLEDGTEIEGWKYFRLEQREAEESRGDEAALEGEEFALETFNGCNHFWGQDDETGEPDGICEECGARCSHKNTKKAPNIIEARKDMPSESIDDWNHIMYADVYSAKECKTCGMLIKGTLICEGTKTRTEHDYRDTYAETGVHNYVCVICGDEFNAEERPDKNTCDHANRYAEYAEGLQPSDEEYEEKFRCTTIDTYKHRLSGSMLIFWNCPDCGKMQWDRGTFDIVQQHDWKNGKCTMCKQKLTCKHPNLGYTYVDDREYRYISNNSNSKYHVWQVQNEYQECEDCGWHKSFTGTVKENHQFTAESPHVCVICGFDGFKYVKSITLNKTKLTVTKGETATLKVKNIKPSDASNKAVAWSSSDESVATVDQSGKITAIEIGTATITCTAQDGSNKTASCKLTVEPVKPKSVTIEAPVTKVGVGETIRLTAVLKPENAETTLTWKSSKKSVATVDVNGLVQAVGEGTAEISVQTANKKSKKIKITVVDPCKPTSVSLDQSGTVELELGQTLTLRATLEPENTAQSELTWKSSSNKIATVKGGVVSPVKAGTATITVSTVKKNAKGKSMSATVKVKVINSETPTKLSLDQKGTVKLELGNMLMLDAMIEPVTAAVSGVTWKSSKPKIASVENGLVKALKAGTATITATTVAKGANGKKLSASVKIQVPKGDEPTEPKILSAEFTNILESTVAPNPMVEVKAIGNVLMDGLSLTITKPDGSVTDGRIIDGLSFIISADDGLTEAGTYMLSMTALGTVEAESGDLVVLPGNTLTKTIVLSDSIAEHECVYNTVTSGSKGYDICMICGQCGTVRQYPQYEAGTCPHGKDFSKCCECSGHKWTPGRKYQNVVIPSLDSHTYYNFLNDDEKHGRASLFMCKNCNELKYVSMMRNIHDQYPHRFGSKNGICIDCGYDGKPAAPMLEVPEDWNWDEDVVFTWQPDGESKKRVDGYVVSCTVKDMDDNNPVPIVTEEDVKKDQEYTIHFEKSWRNRKVVFAVHAYRDEGEDRFYSEYAKCEVFGSLHINKDVRSTTNAKGEAVIDFSGKILLESGAWVEDKIVRGNASKTATKPYYYFDERSQYPARLEDMRAIIDQFDVAGQGYELKSKAETHASGDWGYYQAYGNKSSYTYCTWYVRDVCNAVGASAETGTYTNLGFAEDVRDWMISTGVNRGWVKIGSGGKQTVQNAIQKAQEGYLVIGVYDDGGHVFLVYPHDYSTENDTSVMYIAQAGGGCNQDENRSQINKKANDKHIPVYHSKTGEFLYNQGSVRNFDSTEKPITYYYWTGK